MTKRRMEVWGKTGNYFARRPNNLMLQVAPRWSPMPKHHRLCVGTNWWSLPSHFPDHRYSQHSNKIWIFVQIYVRFSGDKNVETPQRRQTAVAIRDGGTWRPPSPPLYRWRPAETSPRCSALCKHPLQPSSVIITWGVRGWVTPTQEGVLPPHYHPNSLVGAFLAGSRCDC